METLEQYCHLAQDFEDWMYTDIHVLQSRQESLPVTLHVSASLRGRAPKAKGKAKAEPKSIAEGKAKSIAKAEGKTKPKAKAESKAKI